MGQATKYICQTDMIRLDETGHEAETLGALVVRSIGSVLLVRYRQTFGTLNRSGYFCDVPGWSVLDLVLVWSRMVASPPFSSGV